MKLYKLPLLLLVLLGIASSYSMDDPRIQLRKDIAQMEARKAQIRVDTSLTPKEVASMLPKFQEERAENIRKLDEINRAIQAKQAQIREITKRVGKGKGPKEPRRRPAPTTKTPPSRPIGRGPAKGRPKATTIRPGKTQETPPAGAMRLTPDEANLAQEVNQLIQQVSSEAKRQHKYFALKRQIPVLP